MQLTKKFIILYTTSKMTTLTAEQVQDLREEFIFQCETPEEFQRIHLDDNYLKINWRLD